MTSLQNSNSPDPPNPNPNPNPNSNPNPNFNFPYHTVFDDDPYDAEVESNRAAVDGYAVWKQNAPFLYDLLISHALEWPSLTVQWLPEAEERGDYAVQKVVLGTLTGGKAKNYLKIADVELPREEEVEGESAGLAGFGSAVGRKVKIIQQINHEGDVNRARYMPQKPHIIATKSISSGVYVFDCSKRPPKPTQDGLCNPELRLKGHTEEGFGLSWNVFKEGYLLSGSEDSQICFWDINATPKNNIIEAQKLFLAHEDAVQDVAWHLRNHYLFGSVGDDKHLMLWDIRASGPRRPLESVLAHQDKINCLAFNPLNEYLLATGSEDATMKLFDLRKISYPCHTFEYHKGGVTQVCWNLKEGSILASCCVSKKLLVWDLSRIGTKQSEEDAKEGPPELLFIHGGHTSKIYDISWNPAEEWTVASVSHDNILQVWQMSENIYNDKEEQTVQHDVILEKINEVSKQ